MAALPLEVRPCPAVRHPAGPVASPAAIPKRFGPDWFDTDPYGRRRRFRLRVQRGVVRKWCGRGLTGSGWVGWLE